MPRKAEIVDFNEDNEEIRYCKKCLEFNLYSPLKNRIYPDEIPIDHENWLQCHNCGSIYPVNETSRESVIKDVVEKIENVSEVAKNEVIGVDFTKRKTRLEELYDLESEYPEDLQRELKKGSILLDYSQED